MAWGEVKLMPGVDVTRTPTLNQAGISASQLIRFREALVQKLGGCVRLFPFVLPGTPRDLHAWMDLNDTVHLSVAGTAGIQVVTNGQATNITPQWLTTDGTATFATTAGSTTVSVTDTAVSDITTNMAIRFDTPVAVGGIVLSGLYAITEVTGPNSFEITAAVPAVTTDAGGVVPQFTTADNSHIVTVTLPAHGLAPGVGADHQVNFPIATTGNGVTVDGTYTVATAPTADTFTIAVAQLATADGSFAMNGGEAELLYAIAIGPPAAGAGYGLGPYGMGGYGAGSVPATVQQGTPLAAPDWTQDNWGEILLACPQSPGKSGVFQWDPTSGFGTAQLVPTAPSMNGGIFVSTAVQMLICWASTQQLGIGIAQDPLLVAWSDQGDYTDFVNTATNQAAQFRIPTGSEIRAGMAVSNQNLFWTDLDLWVANYLGFPLVWGFNKVGGGAGIISSHAAQFLRSGIYWMGEANFYTYNGSGVDVVPCPLWDAVYQDLNMTFKKNVRAMPNTPFNEAGWLYPSTASASGECDSYVKMNISEGGSWDMGRIPAPPLQRSAWTDQSILGPPVGASPQGVVYQHETSFDADGAPLPWSFTTGYFYIAEGQQMAFVDQVWPDFIWGPYGGSQSAQVQMIIHAVEWPGDDPLDFGPFLFMKGVRYVPVRIRARQMAFTVSGDDVGTFVRLGKCRYQFAPDGRQ